MVRLVMLILLSACTHPPHAADVSITYSVAVCITKCPILIKQAEGEGTLRSIVEKEVAKVRPDTLL